MMVVKFDELTAEEKVELINKCIIDFSSIEHEVADIIKRVRERGDAEIVDFYRRFFRHEVLTKENIKVSSEEIKNAYEHVSERLIEAFKVSAENIEKSHRSQLPSQLFMQEMRKGLYAGW